MCRAWWFDHRGSEVVFTLCSIRWLPLVILQIFTHLFLLWWPVLGSWIPLVFQRLVSRSIYLGLRQQQTCYCAKHWSSKYKLIEGAQWLRHNQWSRSQALIETLINDLGTETAQRCMRVEYKSSCNGSIEVLHIVVYQREQKSRRVDSIHCVRTFCIDRMVIVAWFSVHSCGYFEAPH